MNEIRIRYQGFAPSEFTQRYFQEALQRLHEEAPANSFIRATISKVRDRFKAIVQINSAAGRFFVTATTPRITELGQMVVSRMHRQLDHWKTTRRSNETIRSPFWWDSQKDYVREVKYG